MGTPAESALYGGQRGQAHLHVSFASFFDPFKSRQAWTMVPSGLFPPTQVDLCRCSEISKDVFQS